MRLILKLIAAPLILFLIVLVSVLLFLFSLSSFLLTAASVIMVLLGVGLFFISYPVSGVIYLVIAFLLSPYGFYACYQRQLARGKTKPQALILISRRLISIIYGMLKNKIEYRMPKVLENRN